MNACGCLSHMNLGKMESPLGIRVVDSFYSLDGSPVPKKAESESVHPSVTTTEKPSENGTTVDGRSVRMVQLTV